jgi:hypothetical protein
MRCWILIAAWSCCPNRRISCRRLQPALISVAALALRASSKRLSFIASSAADSAFAMAAAASAAALTTADAAAVAISMANRPSFDWGEVTALDTCGV